MKYEALRRQDKTQLSISYERLREQATSAPPKAISTAQHLFCQRGLAAWLTDFCCTADAPPTPRARVTPTRGGPDPILPDEASGALTCVVASMIHQRLSTGATI